MVCCAFADVNLYQLALIGNFDHQMIAESYINTGRVDERKVEWFDHCILFAILPDLPIAEDHNSKFRLHQNSPTGTRSIDLPTSQPILAAVFNANTARDVVADVAAVLHISLAIWVVMHDRVFGVTDRYSPVSAAGRRRDAALMQPANSNGATGVNLGFECCC